MRLISDEKLKKIGENPYNYEEISDEKVIVRWVADDVRCHLEDRDIKFNEKQFEDFIEFVSQKIYIGCMNEDFGVAIDCLLDDYDFEEDYDIVEDLKEELEEE